MCFPYVSVHARPYVCTLTKEQIARAREALVAGVSLYMCPYMCVLVYVSLYVCPYQGANRACARGAGGWHLLGSLPVPPEAAPPRI